MTETRPTFSVVVPFFNEAGNLPEFLPEIFDAFTQLGAQWEAILVNDASTDETGGLLERLSAHWPDRTVIHFEKNRGQAAALWAGFHAAGGKWIVTLDGDGQNVPADIAVLVPLTQTYDMAVGIRAHRQDSHLRRAMSRIANRVRGSFLRDGLTDSGCALKIFRREVVSSFLPIRTLYSFMPAFAVAGGFRVAEAPVQHRPRRAGQSSYGLRAMAWRPLLDMLAIRWYADRRFIVHGPFRCVKSR